MESGKQLHDHFRRLVDREVLRTIAANVRFLVPREPTTLNEIVGTHVLRNSDRSLAHLLYTAPPLIAARHVLGDGLSQGTAQNPVVLGTLPVKLFGELTAPMKDLGLQGRDDLLSAVRHDARLRAEFVTKTMPLAHEVCFTARAITVR